MSDEPTPSAEEAPTEEFEKPKVRRISNKKPRKTSKENEINKDEDHTSKEEPSSQRKNTEDENSDSKPEPKRNNRRRRGKKTAKNSPTDTSEEETINLGESDSQDSGKDEKDSRGQGHNKHQAKNRSDLDPDKVAKKAWKIFLAEVSEEGVALIADNDARDLARRCFRLAQLFLEEEDRRG